MRKKILILIVVVIAFIILRNTGVSEYLTFENLKQNRDNILNTCRDNHLIFILAFVGIYITVVAFSLPGAAILTITSGFIFGTVTGVILVNISATVGAVLIFLFVRYLIGGWVQKKYNDKLVKFNSAIEKNGVNYLLTLRLIPLFPFFLINLFSGLTKIKLITFVWTTALGIIPGSIAFAYAGSQLAYINSAKDIISGKMLIAFVLLGLITLIPALLTKNKK